MFNNLSPNATRQASKKMCKMNKFLIECFENGKYKATLNAVFETRELARDFIHLYLEGRKECTFLVTPADYYFN